MGKTIGKSWDFMGFFGDLTVLNSFDMSVSENTRVYSSWHQRLEYDDYEKLWIFQN